MHTKVVESSVEGAVSPLVTLGHILGKEVPKAKLGVCGARACPPQMAGVLPALAAAVTPASWSVIAFITALTTDSASLRKTFSFADLSEKAFRFHNPLRAI